MRKIYLSFAIALLQVSLLYGQVKVFSGGNVAIGSTTSTAQEKLHVFGNIFIPNGNSLWVGNNSDSGDRLRFHHSGTNGYIDYATGNLYFRAGTSAKVTFLSNGNVGIASTNPLSKLSIGNDGNSSYFTNIYNASTASGQYGLVVKQVGNGISGSSTALFGGVITGSTNSGYFRGIYSQAKRSSYYNKGRAYAIYGRAGNCGTGYNYGVFGNLEGTAFGAAVYGGINDYNGTYVGGQYAGYFNGDVYVTGTISAATVIDRSDSRLKDSIEPLDEPVEKLFQLEAKKYILISKPAVSTDTTQTQSENMGFFNHKFQYGFIAQDVQQIFPDLVYEGQDGYLGINYRGFIPLLINVVKAQQTEIAQLHAQIDDCCSILPGSNKMLNDPNGMNSNQAGEYSENKTAELFQNNPNPFTVNTEIRYILPAGVKQAYILIFDMQGTLLDTYPLSSDGQGKITIDGGKYRPGMYMYSLIADDKEVDTKKMILTE